MSFHRIEKELKTQLNGIDKRLKKAETLESTAWVGSAIGLGFILSSMTVHVLLLLGMTALGILTNMAAKFFLPK